MPSANQQAETSDETKQAPGSQPALVPIEEWKKWVDMASAAINLFLKVAIALGGCVFFAYSATERFFIDFVAGCRRYSRGRTHVLRRDMYGLDFRLWAVLALADYLAFQVAEPWQSSVQDPPSR